MYLPIPDYNLREQEALAVLPNRIIEAFQPVTFDDLGYPARVRREASLVKYVDVMHELEYDYDCGLLGDLAPGEFDLVQRLTRRVADFTTARFGSPRIARPSVLRSLNVLRHIRHLYGGARPRILELGPGCGYLGAMLMMEGYPYAATDVTQAFYLYQSHFWTHLTGGSLKERAGGAEDSLRADLDRLSERPLHLPWWEYAQARPGDLGPFDLIICNRALGEMHADSLRFSLKLARAALAGAGGPKAFLFDGWGYDYVNSVPDTVLAFHRYGFRAAYASLFCNVFIPEDRNTALNDQYLAETEALANLRRDPFGTVAALAGLLTRNPVGDAIRQGLERQADGPRVPMAALTAFYQANWGAAGQSNPDEDFWTFARTPAPPSVLPDHRPLAIFGAGNLGLQVCQALVDQALPARCFLDNNPAKWGLRLEGLEILAPAALPPGAFVIIAVGPGSREIAGQLVRAGLAPGEDFLFWPGWRMPGPA